ncbi:MAG TPA: ATP-binding protein, partial [Dissulfurispiraceae bacterium]|nr:ATP-binding protein [Dissulfurispiraceae bacterium]
LRDAFQGIEGTEVVSGETGDIIRAAVPDRRRGGVVVTELILPKEITQKIEHLERLHEEHLKLAAFKAPLKLNYILILGFLTLMMVFTALWVSLKVSKGITTPIQSLAMATEQVAGGDLDVSVSATSEDEVGILISSFNQMVRQLKENKQSLENAYTESDKRRLYLENILQSITSGVLFLDHSGRIQAVNRAACSILSMNQEDVTGKDYKTLIGHLNSEDLKQLVRNLEGSEIRDISREIKVNRGGRIIILRVRIAGIRETPESSALGMLVVFDDLTDIIKAQKAMAWQEVARRMAHEIKNPLTPIKLSTERLIRKWKQKESDFDAVFEKSTKTIITEVEGLRRLVDVFSKYGRMPEAQKVPTDMGELLDGVSQLYKGFADVTIGLHIEESLPEIPVDREQFKRVFINIVDNAVKAMNEQGSIDITAKSSGRYLVIEVADTGPGIPDEEKEKLFIPYFSKRRDGTGLGLAIADKIVTDHGGRVLVSDNVPRGSVFTIEIPF